MSSCFETGQAGCGRKGDTVLLVRGDGKDAVGNQGVLRQFEASTWQTWHARSRRSPAEEFMVANELSFDVWKISEARGPIFSEDRIAMAMRDGIHEFVVNPPPVIRGAWRTLPAERLLAWSWAAKEPLLTWVGYEVALKK